MKKLIILITTLTILFGTLPAEAAKEPSLDFLKVSNKNHIYSNISQEGSIKFELNEEIPGISMITGIMDANNAPVDIEALIDGLFDSTITYSAKQKTTNSGEKTTAEVHMKSNSPIIINENLELLINTNYSYWVDLDATDEENLLMDFIMSTPMNRKYIAMSFDDFSEYMTADELVEFNEIKGIVSEIYSSDELLSEMQDKLVASISENASVTGTARNIKIKFSDLGLKKWFADVFEIGMDLYSEDLKEEIMSGSEEMLESLKDVCINVPFFADDALVLEYRLDGKNRIIDEKIQMNVDLNLYELITYLENDTTGLTKENSNISFRITGESNYKYNTVTVKKPELTEENSISFTDLMPKYEEPIEEEYEEYYYTYINVDTDENFYGKNGEKYIPLRNFLETFDYEVSYDNGIITAISDSKYREYDNIKFDVKSNVVNTNSVDYTLSYAPVIINDKSYIRLTDAEKLMNFTTWSYSYYPQDRYGYIGGERNATEEDFQEADL